MKLPRLMEGPAWAVWILYVALVIVLMWGAPFGRSAASSYFHAADAWAVEQDLYTGGVSGYLYPPQSVYVFTPFTWFPTDVGHALWRILGIMLLASGIRLAAVHLPGGRAPEMFALATLLSVCCSIGATKTGQSNLHLAGCMLLGAAALGHGRWWHAALWLGLGLLMKPLALVMILLVGALYPPMRWRLLCVMTVFAALPLLHPNTSYALRQYDLLFDALARAGRPRERPNADLVGLLRTVGVDLAPWVRTGLLGAAALATLGLCWVGLRRRGRACGALLLAALAAGYLMVFNPRTETNSYVILVPYVAFATGVALLVARRYLPAAVGVSACLLLGCDNYSRGFHEWTSPWLKPLIAILFAVVLARIAMRRSALQPS